MDRVGRRNADNGASSAGARLRGKPQAIAKRTGSRREGNDSGHLLPPLTQRRFARVGTSGVISIWRSG